MGDLSPHEPHRPLLWPDIVFELQELLADHPQSIYIVGGAVRDALFQRPLNDLDLVVAKAGIVLAKQIANAFNGDFFVLDAERDVGRALLNTPQGRFIVDVARFRGDDLLGDLTDRDFTINAMVVDLTDDLALLIDPLRGEDDLRAKFVRHCHAQSMLNDPLRCLRAVRQSVQLGMRIEAATLQAVRKAALYLPQVSPERIRDEFIKMLTLSQVRMALRVAESLGLLDTIIPQVLTLRSVSSDNADYASRWHETLAIVGKTAHILTAISPARSDHTAATFGMGMLVMQLDRYRQQLREHTEQQWPNERPHTALLTLAALLSPLTAVQVIECAQMLRLSNSERERLVRVIQWYRQPLQLEDTEPLTLHHFWWPTREAGVDACLLAAAHYLGEAGSSIRQDDWLRIVERLRILLGVYYEQYETIVEPPVLMDGNHLIAALGLKPGPLIGKLLAHIREAQVTGQAETADEALAAAREYLDRNN